MQRSIIFICALSFLCVWPIMARAQPAKKVFSVGLLSTTLPRTVPVFMRFEQCMQELGYEEGKNWAFEFRSAEGQPDRLSSLANELAHLPVDAIIAPGPEATLRAASQATNTIPIVTMAVNYDPVARGYIKSLAKPGGNITGVFFMQTVLSAKRLSLLKETLPQLARVFALLDAHSADQLPATEAAAQSLGLELQSLVLQNPPYDFNNALEVAIHNRAQALIVLSSPIFYGQRSQLAELTIKHQLPAMFLFSTYAKVGGLMSYGVNINDFYCYATSYIDKILNGAKPAELPVEQPTKFELVINLKTARMLGLTLPPSVLFQADAVIK